MAKKIKFIWIGKLKKSFWKEAFDHYWHRLSHSFSLKEHCLKEARNTNSRQQIQQLEARSISNLIQPKDYPICIDSQGTALSSSQLANHLLKWQNLAGKTPCFIIGGSYGFPKEFLNKSLFTLSLGPMTFPHELARIILLEQLYRATTISLNHPYHH